MSSALGPGDDLLMFPAIEKTDRLQPSCPQDSARCGNRQQTHQPLTSRWEQELTLTEHLLHAQHCAGTVSFNPHTGPQQEGGSPSDGSYCINGGYWGRVSFVNLPQTSLLRGSSSPTLELHACSPMTISVYVLESLQLRPHRCFPVSCSTSTSSSRFWASGMKRLLWPLLQSLSPWREATKTYHWGTGNLPNHCTWDKNTGLVAMNSDPTSDLILGTLSPLSEPQFPSSIKEELQPHKVIWEVDDKQPPLPQSVKFPITREILHWTLQLTKGFYFHPQCWQYVTYHLGLFLVLGAQPGLPSCLRMGLGLEAPSWAKGIPRPGWKEVGEETEIPCPQQPPTVI